jgi:serine/threonine protein kinase
VFETGPHWWVKIGDFGISKRVETGSTALRTRVGTEHFAAPELLGILTLEELRLRTMEPEDLSYSFAVDIWSLGVICFKLLTNELPFPIGWMLSAYVTTGSAFPTEPLTKANASKECQEFVEKAMMRSASQRPAAGQLCASPWLSSTKSRTVTLGDEDVTTTYVRDLLSPTT